MLSSNEWGFWLSVGLACNTSTQPHKWSDISLANPLRRRVDQMREILVYYDDGDGLEVGGPEEDIVDSRGIGLLTAARCV